MTEKEILDSVDIHFYANTPGCYIVSNGVDFVVAQRCYKEKPIEVYEEGPDLYIKYLKGDMKFLLGFVSEDVEYIGWERLNHPELCKFYPFEKIKERILTETCS